MEKLTVIFFILCLVGCRSLPEPAKVLFGGEMHNSNASTPSSIDASLDLAKALGYNCVLAPVTWEQMEPTPGEYDFSQVDYLVESARKRGLYLGMLWFGVWKNGESSYPPLWVKEDVDRFFRAEDADGSRTTTISPFCADALEVESRAFAALMAHLRRTDKRHTVLAVQVENECGVFLERDFCPAARKAWEESEWASSHDSLAPQHFMAEAFARYVDAVAAAGKKEYDIPMFTNAWLKPASAPYGSYPNGGPRIAVLDTWKANTKTLDWLSPDVYDPGFAALCEPYCEGQTLFIPETRREIGRYYYAFGEKHASGVFGFGFEESYDDPYYTVECRTFAELLPYLDHGFPSRGFFRETGVHAQDDTLTLSLGGYEFAIHYIAGERNAHGMILQTAENEFIVAGVGAWIDFASGLGEECKLVSCEELCDGAVCQFLNGDETGHGNMLYLRGRLHLEDYEAPDGVVNPAPDYGFSYQRRFWPEVHARFKTSGIYRIKLYTYPSK